MPAALARAKPRWLDRRYGQRWHRNYQDFGFVPLDPRYPGEHLWRIMGGTVIRAQLADALPASIEVRHDDHGYRVVPLPEVECHHQDAARLLRRVRERLGT
jgi:hypothetical protein